jgi:nicotinamidase/pyrazinamidase
MNIHSLEQSMTKSKIPFKREQTALLLVDLQPDFMPGGALPVKQGDTIIPPIRELMERDLFGLYAATQDWHPPGHASFASVYEGQQPFDEIERHGKPQTLWPDHCVQSSSGAALHSGIPWNKVTVILRKGMEREVDSYSGFRNNWNAEGERPATGLAGYLHERGIRALFICGLARDVCVKWTAEDAAAAGFETHLLWDLSKPVDPESDFGVRAELERAGVRILETRDLISN